MSGGPNPRAAREGAAGWRAGTELCVLLACFAGQRQAAKIRRQLDKRIGQSRDAVLDQVVVKINAKRRAQVHDPRRSLGGILTPALTWGIFGLLAGGLQSLAVYAMLGAVSGSPGVPSRSLSRRFDGGWVGNLAGRSITAVLRASPSRIFAGHPWNSRIWPRVYRPLELVIPGTTDAADEMVGHIRHGQPLRQSERQWLDIEVPGWPAGRAFDLKEFAVPDEVADRHRLAPERLGLAPAASSVPIALELGGNGGSGGTWAVTRAAILDSRTISYAATSAAE